MFEDRIPTILKEDPSWVCVRDANKVPLNPSTRRFASPSNKNTWNEFKVCLNAVYSGEYDGLGYCFHNNGIIGIDIDDGYDDDGFLSSLAVDIISTCSSYTEKSRSGRGMHIYLKGVLPFKGANNQKGVEIYSDCRFFIVTGEQMLFSEIIENQKAINYILEKYFSNEKINKRGEKGEKNRLYNPIIVNDNGKLVTKYPPIPTGCRNNSLLSLASQCLNKGMTQSQIFERLVRVNNECCDVPLEENEIKSIIKSVLKYERDNYEY